MNRMWNYQLYARILRLWNDDEDDVRRRTPYSDVGTGRTIHWIAQDKTLVWC